jgi:inorganic pyrophosphatase
MPISLEIVVKVVNMMPDYFEFHDPGHLVDGDLELVLVKKDPFDPATGWVPQYHFEMRQPGENLALGSIRLRIGSGTALRYAGHIGYDVKPEFRGNDYAARASRLLFALAYSHGLKEVYLNVDPQNIASTKTCKKIGAERIETIHLKKVHFPWTAGSRFHRRYRVDLEKALDGKKPEIRVVRPELYIGQAVSIKIDRPLGSLHAYHKEIVFCLNYGYLPAVLSADGDDLDAYLLGVFEPVSEYTGRCIAVITRRDENDPKLVVVPEGKEYSDAQITALTEFLERFHDSYVVR